MARTNIEIDDGLVEKAMRLTGATTKPVAARNGWKRILQRCSGLR